MDSYLHSGDRIESLSLQIKYISIGFGNFFGSPVRGSRQSHYTIVLKTTGGVYVVEKGGKREGEEGLPIHNKQCEERSEARRVGISRLVASSTPSVEF